MPGGKLTSIKEVWYRFGIGATKSVGGKPLVKVVRQSRYSLKSGSGFGDQEKETELVVVATMERVEGVGAAWAETANKQEEIMIRAKIISLDFICLI